jgi:hypothetical protein
MSDADSIRRAYEVWNESGPAAVTDQFCRLPYAR